MKPLQPKLKSYIGQQTNIIEKTIKILSKLKK